MELSHVCIIVCYFLLTFQTVYCGSMERACKHRAVNTLYALTEDWYEKTLAICIYKFHIF